MIFFSVNGKWNDFLPSNLYTWDQQGYVVEYAPSTNQQPVPEPATMLLFGTGIAGLAAVARKKRKV